MNPFGTHHCQRCPMPNENHHRDPRIRRRDLKRHWMPRARRTNQMCRRDHLRNQTMKEQQKNHEGMPDPRGASSSSTAAASSTPPDPCETTPARRTRQRSPDPPIGVSPATPLPKRSRSVNVDDKDMVAAIAEVTEVCEEPQTDWEALASRENIGSTRFMHRHGARMVHLV